MNGDGRTDLFLYNVVTLVWFESFVDGAGQWSHVGGSWSPGWGIHVTSFNLDALADVLLYDPVSGAYFQGINTGPGTLQLLRRQLGCGSDDHRDGAVTGGDHS